MYTKIVTTSEMTCYILLYTVDDGWYILYVYIRRFIYYFTIRSLELLYIQWSTVYHKIELTVPKPQNYYRDGIYNCNIHNSHRIPTYLSPQ